MLNRNGTQLTVSAINGSFDIVSFWASAAFQVSVQILAQGFYNNLSVYTQIETVFELNCTLIQLNWINIDTVTLTSTPSGIGYQFAIDNLIVTFP